RPQLNKMTSPAAYIHTHGQCRERIGIIETADGDEGKLDEASRTSACLARSWVRCAVCWALKSRSAVERVELVSSEDLDLG
ncbi:MAG: hypothetical protein ACXWCP_22200, partial [Burkholderiales bacterium]